MHLSLDTKVINKLKASINPSTLTSHQTSDTLSVGTKCALLKNLETVEHEFTLVKTCRAKKSFGTTCWDPVMETEVLNLIDNLEHNQDGPLLESVTVLSLNVWFADRNKERRFERIIEVIEQTSPDFVCLQEVQLDFKAKLRLSKIISSTYYISNSNIREQGINSMKAFGVMILSKWPCEFINYPYTNTTQARSLLACQTILNGVQLIVATTHIESREDDLVRGEQVKECMKILDQHQNVVLTGDFNFEPTDTPQRMILPKFLDTYTQTPTPDTPDYTWTTACPKPKKNETPQGRIDRILLKSSRMVTQSFDLLGQDEVEGSVGKCRTMSDHYGLISVMSMVEKPFEVSLGARER